MKDEGNNNRRGKRLSAYIDLEFFTILGIVITALAIYYFDTFSASPYISDAIGAQTSYNSPSLAPSLEPGPDLDERFAFSKSAEVAEAVGAVWGYNWGNGSAHPNQNELNYYNDYNRKVFFTVGKLDVGGGFHAIADDPAPYLADQSEIDAYAEVDALIDSIPSVLTDPDIIKLIKGSYLYIPNLADMDITHYWVIANEPDWIPFVPPDWYAQWYKLFSERIRKYDPLAKVSFGGLIRVKYEFDALQAEPDWRHEWLMGDGYVQALIDAVTAPEDKDRIERNAWFHYFREYYNQEYGEYPVFDFVNIHVYTLLVNVSPDGPDVTSLVNIGKGHLDTMLEYMDHYGMSDLPVWVTEFAYLDEPCGPVYDPDTGIPATNDIYFTECTDMRASNGFQMGYFEQMIEYFVTNRRVQRFFPWALGEHYTHAFLGYRDYTSDIFYKDSTEELNDIGVLYQSLAAQFDDSTPPVIATPAFDTGGSSIGVSTTVTDPGTYSSGPVEYWYSVSDVAITSIDTPADLQDWDFILTTSEQFDVTVPLDMVGGVFNLIVRDSAGNEAVSNTEIPPVDPGPDPDPVDLNNDGDVNIADYALFLDDYLDYRNNGNFNDRSDLNGDLKVNIGDYALFLDGFLAYY